MRIFIGSDHAGFALKEHVKSYLERSGHDVVDVGTHSDESVDYPDYALAVARAVASGEADLGVLVCGTGLGMEIAANKVRGVRAVQVMDPELAVMARKHNDANVLTLAGRHTDPQTAERIVDAFVSTAFEGGRHERRVGKIAAIEQQYRPGSADRKES
ncbi:ribose 5-phosphate isomerase B [Coriobacteriia bacterium Es71-Z0120]|uniref:ribose 5-phosphate isomerase B n=1 Tax=Parvivirga hydrogeniphila TaxID=2939460 RepID=UPI002260D795|nr:ribose 5-phosphate isomerase B [Parvivirga hydrogeniphila]MCL4078766.1 ribose 5-phosphate isomerase B [Parvivirga hydrogeniphila]